MSSSTRDDRSSRARRGRPKPFPFFDLPTELRLKIYEYVLVVPGRVLDLDYSNHRLILPRIQCFYACRRMYEEAYPIFYGYHSLRLYPLPAAGKFFRTKKPLLARLGPRYRAALTTLELRLGPGWTDPPRGQNTDASLGLADCISVRMLKILVEIDPSDRYFEGFRGSCHDENFYILFCVNLLQGILEQLPNLKVVELDAYPGVAKRAPIILSLSSEVAASSKQLVWGPLRGWNDTADCGQLGLESALAAMSI